MIKYMLDTNICIYAMKEKPASVYLAFKQHQGMMCISTITLMELLYGAEKSAYPAKNIAVVEDFVARLEILTFDDAAASHAAQLRAELSNAGTPFGPSDTMIAGHARSIGVILVSNNTREFTRVTGLRLKDWV
jgi:tRNA(fMet)-specific endonuclease VapC